ncbi:auxin efflux carrier component 1b-related [Anaeramoeba flamelloides]|uniref:Auxin efflux carrier component 1b-related n=1 Tax=Anaeramoeba flamelloides TaxID=1746091 RepID=A0AAV7Z3V5_9EUKA|nr:auxin efflux carrier component 1b-related [Anaeramoeba flamelloides]
MVGCNWIARRKNKQDLSASAFHAQQDRMLLIEMMIGYLLAKTKVIKDPQLAIKHINTFVFRACIPTIVFRSFLLVEYENIQWSFFLIFLGANIIGIAILFVMKKFGLLSKFFKESFVITYMTMNWPNNIIFGIPIISEVLGEEFAIYAILGNMVNFFRMPFLVILFENDKVQTRLQNEYQKGVSPNEENGPLSEGEEEDDQKKNQIKENIVHNESDNFEAKSSRSNSSKNQSTEEDIELLSSDVNESIDLPSKTNSHKSSKSPQTVPIISKKKLFKRIGYALLTNPPIWGTILGFIYIVAIKTVPDFLWDVITPISACTVPCSCLSIGMFICIIKFGKAEILTAIKHLFARHIIFPSMMLALSLIFGLTGKPVQACVVVGCLPLALSSFAFATEYEKGRGTIAPVIIIGSIAQIVFILFWIAIVSQFESFK